MVCSIAVVTWDQCRSGYLELNDAYLPLLSDISGKWPSLPKASIQSIPAICATSTCRICHRCVCTIVQILALLAHHKCSLQSSTKVLIAANLQLVITISNLYCIPCTQYYSFKRLNCPANSMSSFFIIYTKCCGGRTLTRDRPQYIHGSWHVMPLPPVASSYQSAFCVV